MEEKDSIREYVAESTYESVTDELTEWNKGVGKIASSIELDSKKIEFYEEKIKFQKYKEEMELMSNGYKAQIDSFGISSRTIFSEIMQQLSSLKMKGSLLEPLDFERIDENALSKLKTFNLECELSLPRIKQDFEDRAKKYNSESQQIDSIVASSYEKYNAFAAKFQELLSIFEQVKKDNSDKDKELFHKITKELSEVIFLHREALITKKLSDAQAFQFSCNLLCNMYEERIDELLPLYRNLLEIKNAKNEEKTQKTEDKKEELTSIIEEKQKEPKDRMLDLIQMFVHFGMTNERLIKQLRPEKRQISGEEGSILVNLHSFIFNRDPSNFGIEDVDKLEGLLSKMGLYSMYDTESKEKIKNEIEAYKNEILERKGRSR